MTLSRLLALVLALAVTLAAPAAALAANLYVQTTGASTNSGDSDSNTADLSGTTGGSTGVSFSGTTTITFAAGTDLSAAAGRAIYIDNASNANKKIFWIASADDGADTAVVDVAPTGTSPINWSIGGRQTVVQTCVDALRAGDTLTINDSPASTSGIHITTRVTGTLTAPITVQGKTGTFPVIQSTAAATIFVGTGQDWWIFDNLDIRNSSSTATHYPVQTGASAIAITLRNCKVSASGNSTRLFLSGGISAFVIGCEFTGAASEAAIYTSGGPDFITDCWIHDITVGAGIKSNGNSFVTNTIIERCAGNGAISITAGQPGMVLQNCTIYRCDNSGLETTGTGEMHFFNCIVMDNGNAANEYNVEFATTQGSAISRNNCISIAGSRGGGNVSGYTLASSDITGDPLFVDPDNATAASRNFGLQSGSPCKATGFPGAFEGSSGTTGYLDMGAVQRQEPTASGGASAIGLIGGRR